MSSYLQTKLPEHLKKYIVDQPLDKYTAIDHAVWRFILRQLKKYLSVHGHESYLKGLEETGIEIECIPSIESISTKLKRWGWEALPVSGFIPPSAFMELQALGILPIASEMRSLEHLGYTPAPDIVHEAAGHAPLLFNKEYSTYLKDYALVAKKAIISSEDLNLYSCIRKLSDIKENPISTPADIANAEEELRQAQAKITHVSEAAQLARMNWWTAEYGLIGSLQNPKIYGAGLLSSVTESRWCLSENVKKIPLTVDCIQVGYDITEPQPQLFVASDFTHLKKVLHEFTQTMAFKMGGVQALHKAQQAKTVNTVELNSGLQISGILADYFTDEVIDQESCIFARWTGPVQICYQDQPLPQQSAKDHSQGFSTPLGFLQKFATTCPTQLPIDQWSTFQQQDGSYQLVFTSGIVLRGRSPQFIQKNNLVILISWTEAEVTYKGKVLFDKSWGRFDLALGHKVKSVYSGPVYRLEYPNTEDFEAKKIPPIVFSDPEILKQNHYLKVRQWRSLLTTHQMDKFTLANHLKLLIQEHQSFFPEDWLLILEIYELAVLCKNEDLKKISQEYLQALSQKNKIYSSFIEDGLSCADDF